MHVEFSHHYSGYLNREMYFNRYGHAGLPVVVFPSSGGSHNEYADFGMINACRKFIDRGQLQFYTVDSIDNESWLSEWKRPNDKAQMHQRYEDYIIGELIPYIKYQTNHFGPMMTTGNSMGAYHAVNAGLKHPDVFNIVIGLSGIYDARFLTGDYNGDQAVFYNSPTDFLWTQEDPWFLDQYRQNHFIICTGQGAWEEDSVADTEKLEAAFNAKSIPAWFDYWGHDVKHDWEWWRIQMPYYLNVLNEQGII